MGQITHPNLGSPMAMVSSDARLHTTGSVTNMPNMILDKARIRGSGLVVFDEMHDRIIEGKTFMIGSYVSPPGIPADSSGGILLCVGSKDVHFNYSTRTDGDCIFEIMENVQVTNSGTLMPFFNANRTSSTTINSAMWANPTVTNSGLVIYSALLLGGSGADTKFASAPAGTGVLGDDLMLANGSCYWIQYRNICGRNMLADFDADMHEHG